MESVAPPAEQVGGDPVLSFGGISTVTRFWPVAAVVGGTWGAVEITLGGFLHALRMPFVGLVMALLQAGFFIAMRRVHPVRGLLAVSGTLAAAVKLMVPSGALISPSLGIAAEGLLLEFAFLVLPGAWAASVGTSLALLWSMLQTVISQILLFGWDVLALYSVLLKSASQSLGTSVPQVGAGLLLLAVAILGCAVGLWAHHLGARMARELSKPDSELVLQVAALRAQVERAKEGTRHEVGGERPKSSGLGTEVGVVRADMNRVQQAAVIGVGVLALASLFRPGMASVLGLAVLTAVLVVTRRACLVRLLRWRFWLAAALVAFATGLVLTVPRLPHSGLEWLVGALSAAGMLLVRVALLSEIAVVALELFRIRPGRWMRLDTAGHVMAETWSILPDALGLIELELETLRGRSHRWERLRFLPRMLELLLVWALLVAHDRGYWEPVGGGEMKIG